MMKKDFVVLALSALILSGCSSPLSASNPPTSAAAAEQATFTAPPPLPSATVEATIAPTATPFTPFEVSALVDHLNVRSNPGSLFDVLTNVPQGTKFQVLGKTPGGEWFLVQSENGSQGWIFGQLLESEQDMQSVPVIMPANVQVLEGRIMNEAGQAVSGIQFAFVQEQFGKQLRSDGNSDENGVFLVFMPPEISGTWTVSYTAISCTSNTMDASCNCLNGACGTVSPASQTIELPQKEPALFTWVIAR